MKKVNIKELNMEDFVQYGSFANMVNPDGPSLGEEPIEFFRDRGMLPLGGSDAAFSTCRVCERPLAIDTSEYHHGCGEAILPLDGDVLVHVAPADAGEAVPVDAIEVFRVPMGTVVMLRPGVWHHAAFAYRTECVNVLIVLPERTYATDCHVFSHGQEEQVAISET